MNGENIIKQYISALECYLAKNDEFALNKAYEIGRKALDKDQGILDMVAIHKEALEEIQNYTSEENIRTAKWGYDFFLECLAPFEITHRGFKEANESLKDEISKLKQAEDVIQKRTTELEAVNKELESFSYSVSHDLRAPLRAIDGFSRILLEDYSSLLDKEGVRVLDTIIKSTEQMGNLIDNLLTFSRFGRQTMSFIEINMKHLAKTISKELKLIEPQRKIQIIIKQIPPAYGDITMIRAVLVNLLSNSIKYTRGRETATIEVGGSSEEKVNTYYVKDNGVGFDMKYQDKLFEVFQRLHRQEDFEGTGIGLANVEKIIHRHRGTVWAEGKVNGGATFYFTIPNKGSEKYD